MPRRLGKADTFTVSRPCEKIRREKTPKTDREAKIEFQKTSSHRARTKKENVLSDLNCNAVHLTRSRNLLNMALAQWLFDTLWLIERGKTSPLTIFEVQPFV